METKSCQKCNIEINISEYSFRTDTQNYRNECKSCKYEKDKKYQKKNKDKTKINQNEYREENKQKL